MIANKKSILALSIASALMLSGCFSDDDNNVVITPPEPTDPVVVAPEVPAELGFVVNGAVINDADSNVVDATVRFLENGAPATSIVNANGDQVQELQTGEEGGFVITRKDGSDTESVTAVVSADGFVTKSFIIDLANADGVKVVNVELALLEIGKVGIAADTKEGAVANGDTGAEIEASATSGDNAVATATLPQGTALKDKNGEAVEGATATLSVVGVEADSTSKGQILPEGLNANADTQVDVPVSVADINLLVGSTAVKSFENGELSVKLAAPDLTGVDAGDLSVSSFDTDTGNWMADDFAVTKNVDGTVSFNTDHLTFFAVTRKQAICENPVAANITGTVPTGGLVFTAVSSDGAFSAPLPPGTATRQFISAANAKRYGISADASARIKVRDREGGVWFETQNEVAICAEDPIAITLTAPFTLVDKQLTLNGVCANDANVSVDLSNSTVKYKRAGKGVRTALKDANGNFQLTNLREGETYQVSINFRGVPVTTANTFELDSVNADDLARTFEVTCPTTTGSTGTTGGN
ncbi:hypothetical protein [Pseudoalteromonas piscicida]|uniref:hypothetical protein n=1 Tax=Pseudoalteromonas piscicida TaxID=43662 RepID=UPI0030A1EC9B